MRLTYGAIGARVAFMQEVIREIRDFALVLDEAETLDEARDAFESVQAALDRIEDAPKPVKGSRFCGSCGRRCATIRGREVLHKADCPEASARVEVP